MKQTLELIVRELDCADEAGQIRAALSRLLGVEEVGTGVAAPRAIAVRELERVQS